MDNKNSKKILEQIGYGMVFTLAFIGIFATMSPYVLPRDLHRQIALVFYGYTYTTEQLPIMAKSPVLEFLHRFAGFLYMVIGPIQFMPSIRNRYLRFHRLAGRVFVFLSLVGGATELVMVVLFPFSGIQESIPTFFFCTIFLYCNYKALRCALERKIALHREWMIRGFSIGLGIATIRVIVLIFMYTTNWNIKEIILSSFWLGWSISLTTAECWINCSRRSN